MLQAQLAAIYASHNGPRSRNGLVVDGVSLKKCSLNSSCTGESVSPGSAARHSLSAAIHTDFFITTRFFFYFFDSSLLCSGSALFAHECGVLGVYGATNFFIWVFGVKIVNNERSGKKVSGELNSKFWRGGTDSADSVFIKTNLGRTG